MLKLLSYILENGLQTVKDPCPPFSEAARGMPVVTDSPCVGSGCNACAEACPTDAITVSGDKGEGKIALDLGACVNCGLCVDLCPTDTIAENKNTRLAQRRREDLIMTNDPALKSKPDMTVPPRTLIFNSVHARVVSTGCSATDMELGASGNPNFDIERFGVHIVASPRHADALIVTGPVSKGMQDPLRRCYGAMAEPKAVIAMGTCAISGGVHRNGYTDANGVDNVLPVDVYVPGCPPHPWTIIHGIRVAMGKAQPEPPIVRTKADKAKG
jgi:Ni,Fe-hydrogenase III small subunit/formate hydrogenlyase subunit 6/NADH:ubiquinone oxidoreductase subunit I